MFLRHPVWQEAKVGGKSRYRDDFQHANTETPDHPDLGTHTGCDLLGTGILIFEKPAGELQEFANLR